MIIHRQFFTYWTPSTKHTLHCLLYLTIIVVFEIKSGSIKLWYSDNDEGDFDPSERYGFWLSWFLYLLRLMTLLSLPQFVFNFCGLVLWNAFEEIDTDSTKLPLNIPFVCIRTVTRGDFPLLTRKNLIRNLETLRDVGLENFLFEIVSDKEIDGLPKDPKVRLVVVPKTYRTRTGTLYKVRMQTLFDRTYLLSVQGSSTSIQSRRLCQCTSTQ